MSLVPIIEKYLVALCKAVHLGTPICRILDCVTSHTILDINDTENARDILSDYHCDTGSTCIGCNSISPEPKYDLQIIIPIYNTEKYLKECIESVLSQQCEYSFCVTIIDDGSVDNCGYIADSYSGDSRVTVIHQRNKGLSGARNTGLTEIAAKYVMFVDSDDRLCQGAITELLNIAVNNDADIVQGDIREFHGCKKSIPCKFGISHPSSRSVLAGYACGKVYRSKLFEQIVFPERYWYEDTMNHLVLHSLTDNIWITSSVVYEYRQHQKSITHTSNYNKKALDTFWITERMIKDRIALGLNEDAELISILRGQLCTNANRIKHLPLEIRHAVFILSANIFIDMFNKNSEHITNQADIAFYLIFKDGDYTKFELIRNLGESRLTQ